MDPVYSGAHFLYTCRGGEAFLPLASSLAGRSRVACGMVGAWID